MSAQLLMPEQDNSWFHDAACKGMDQSIFFPERGQNSREAVQICDRCPVQAPCRQYAHATQSSGIWAGRLRRNYEGTA